MHGSWKLTPDDSEAIGRERRTYVVSIDRSRGLLDVVESQLQRLNNFDPSSLPHGVKRTAAEHAVAQYVPLLLKMNVQLSVVLGEPIPEQAAEYLKGQTES